jgi:hypothetical protein
MTISIDDLTETLKKFLEAKTQALEHIVIRLDEVIELFTALGMEYEVALEGWGYENETYTVLCLLKAVKSFTNAKLGKKKEEEK